MKAVRRTRLGILTGGGDVAPLNAVIAAALSAAERAGAELVGFPRGWQGVLEQRIVRLTPKLVDPAIGGTILRSSRINLAKVDGGADAVRETCRRHGIDGLIVIGGEDTLSNAFHIGDVPQALISKTIDNDVGTTVRRATSGADMSGVTNYFTLGHPTAAEKIASFVSLDEGMRTTAYSHERIIIVESMGMHAGWLALSSCMGHPDFIIVPEFPLDYGRFVEMVAQRFRRQKHVIAVIAEGARWSDGSYMSADDSERDSFGHPRFKGAASTLAGRLKEDLRPHFDTRNVNFVNPSYLYRSGAPSRLDASCAARLGRDAVKRLVRGLDRPVFLTLARTGTGFGITDVTLDRFNDIEDFHRFINKELYNPETLNATPFARRYLANIVREHRRAAYGL